MYKELGKTIVPEMIVDAGVCGMVFQILVTSGGRQWHLPVEAMCEIFEIEVDDVVRELVNHHHLKHQLRWTAAASPLENQTKYPCLDLWDLIELMASNPLEGAERSLPPITAALARLLTTHVLSKRGSLDRARVVLAILANLYGQPVRLANRRAVAGGAGLGAPATQSIKG